jgi:aminoglycoside phosphotransferase (APT) family kinase protein
VVPEGVGHSNETVLVDAHWTADGERHDGDFVVRLQITGPGVFPTYDLGLQVRCMRAVAEHSDVPVPHVRWLEEDPSVLGRTFYVMDRIDGLVPADRMPYTIDGFLLSATPEEQARAHWSSLEAMAALHRMDWQAAGLGFLDRSEHGPAGLAQQLAWYEGYHDWVCDGRPQPTIDAARAWLREHLPADPPPTGLTWGDARLSNIMFRDFRAAAVLDWEMAALGPAEVDLAWFLFFQRFFSEGLGIADLPGFPPAAESVARYAELLGRDLADLFWYEVFAAWRHSTVMLRLADLYEASGDFPPGNGAGQNNIASRMLAALLDLPSPGEPGGLMG